MRKGKAACVRAGQLMLMMLGLFGWNASGAQHADAHDAGAVGLECVRAMQLMLMMLGLLGWNA